MHPAKVGTWAECISNIQAFSGHLNEVHALLGSTVRSLRLFSVSVECLCRFNAKKQLNMFLVSA